MATTQRVKKLKVMQSNGQFGNPIPLGTDAKYVDLENGRTVESEFAHRNNLIVDYYSELPTSGIEEGEIGYVRYNSVPITREYNPNNTNQYYYIYFNPTTIGKMVIPDNDLYVEHMNMFQGDNHYQIFLLQGTGTTAFGELNDNLLILVLGAPLAYQNFAFIYSFKPQTFTFDEPITLGTGWYSYNFVNENVQEVTPSEVPHLFYGKMYIEDKDENNINYEDSILYDYIYTSIEPIDINDCYYNGHYIYENGEWKYNEAWVEVIEDVDNILVRLDTGEGVI